MKQPSIASDRILIMQAFRLLDVYQEYGAFQILCDKLIHLSINSYKFQLWRKIPRDIRQMDYFSRVH